MRSILSIILVAILSAVAEYFLPWWSMAVVCALISLFMKQTPGRSFLMGFLGIAICWGTVAILHDVANEHILSTRMAALFHLPKYGLFIAVSTLVGALVGGLSAWAAALANTNRK